MATYDLSRREFLASVGAGALGAASLGLPESLFGNAAPGGERPNVLFIAVDDLRPQLGCYGNTQMITPSFDRLASGGVVFERSFCNYPVCGASRASLLSGARPTWDRFLNYYTRVVEDYPEAVTLPRLFRDNGYHTISNGKVYHHRDDDPEAWSEEPWRARGEHRYLTEQALRTEHENEVAGNGRRGPAYEAADVPDSEYPDGELTDKTINDLRRMKELGKPFFLAAGFARPHLPFNAPRRYWDMYPAESINLAENPFRPEGAPDQAIHNWGELRQYAHVLETGPLTDGMALNMIRGYYASTTYVDTLLGQILDELERLGLRENTIIVLWGDHGWQLGEHGLWCKHCNFQTSLRAPLIISAPGAAAGEHCEALTEFVDIYPTLCDLAGLGKPSHLEGSSLAPLLRDPDREWKQAVFSKFHSGWSVRTDRYLYTEWWDRDGTVEARMLYDHLDDPAENHNIAELPQNRAVVERLSGLLRRGWQPVRRELEASL